MSIEGKSKTPQGANAIRSGEGKLHVEMAEFNSATLRTVVTRITADNKKTRIVVIPKEIPAPGEPVKGVQIFSAKK